ncbi:MAG: glycosyltransferase family 2 protein [Vicinamibacterales bacterium]
MRRAHEWWHSDPRPAISVVLATTQRARLLRGALEGLAAQTLPRSVFEVIVIDDGSTDSTRDVVASFESALTVRYAYQRPAGLSSARNHGIFSSSGDIVLFLDDDDVASPDLLEQHLRAHCLHPEPRDAVLGFTGLASEVASDPLMRFVTEVEGHLFSYGSIASREALDFRHFWGGRTSCKRVFLLDHGVFNPAFRIFCEDIELAYRLSKHDLRVFYHPGAVSLMHRAIPLEGFCERLHRQGQANYRFSQLHDDEAVHAWTGVRDAQRAWPSVAAHYDDTILAARHADRLARLKLESGLTLESSDLHWLHCAYSAAFRAAKMKGIVDASTVNRA